MKVSKITFFALLAAMAFAQMSLNAATNSASSAEILQAQREVLQRLTSRYGEQRYAERKISEYVKKGYPKEAFEPDELTTAVAKDMFKEINSADSRKRDMLLFRAKRTYGLEYEDFAGFVTTRTGFAGILDKYLTCQSDTVRREYFQSLVSTLFSTQEIRVLTERFSEAKTHETKTRLLKLFETESSAFSAKFLWKYLVDYIDDPVRNDIIDVLGRRRQLEDTFIRAAIDKAIEKGYTRFLQRAFGFAGREHSLRNRVATKILLDYLKNAPPERVNLIVPHIKRVIPPGTINTMFAILNRADYSVCHYEVSSVLAKHFEKPEIKDKLVAFLLKKQSKKAALGFIDGVSLSWAIARRDDSGKEKLISILNELSSIYDDEVKKAVAKKLGTADDHQQRLNKRKKDKSLMMVQRYLQYCELSHILPKGKTKNAGPGFDQIMAMAENSMKEAESLGADKKSLSELRKQIDETKKMQLIFDAENQVESRTREANDLRARIKKKYDKPEQLLDIHSLDNVNAYYVKEDNMIVISGSWEAGYPCVLERAEHIFKEGGALVSLYWKPYFNTRGQTSTIFAVRIPVVGKAPQVISVNGPREARKLSVRVQDKPIVFNNWSLVVDSQSKYVPEKKD